MADIFRFRTVELIYRDGTTRSEPFAHPWAAELYLYLIPFLQLAGNREVRDVARARLTWTDLNEARRD